VGVDELQRSVRGFVEAHGLEASAEVRLLDLLSEVGELAKEALKVSEYGHRAFTPTPDWQDELGDALFSLFCLANETGVDVEQALHGALQKYERRLAAGGDAGSGR
jgi:NTP pyrophosphatase (non-canonical NTP hydrolase)